jgi:hypothetical protein
MTPHIKFAVAAPLAISRGFAVSGLCFWRLTQGGALPESRLPWATIVRPFRAFSLLLRSQLEPDDLADRVNLGWESMAPVIWKFRSCNPEFWCVTLIGHD